MLRLLAAALLLVVPSVAAAGDDASLGVGLALPVLSFGDDGVDLPRTLVLLAPIDRDGIRLLPELGFAASRRMGQDGGSFEALDTTWTRFGLALGPVTALGDAGRLFVGPRGTVTWRRESAEDLEWSESFFDWHLGLALGAEALVGSGVTVGTGVNLGWTQLSSWPTTGWGRADDLQLPVGLVVSTPPEPEENAGFLTAEAVLSVRFAL